MCDSIDKDLLEKDMFWNNIINDTEIKFNVTKMK